MAEGDSVGCGIGRRTPGFTVDVVGQYTRHVVVGDVALGSIDRYDIAVVAPAMEIDVAVGVIDLHRIVHGRVPAAEDHRVAHAVILETGQVALVDVLKLVGITVPVSPLVVRSFCEKIGRIHVERLLESERLGPGVVDRNVVELRVIGAVQVH